MSFSAESYERYMVPSLFAQWAPYVIRSSAPQPGERILDVACGTGIVARRIAPSVGSQGKVIGLDRNPDMLRVAQQASECEGLAVEWRLGQAEELPFPDGAFDVIVCQFGLMFFTDQHAALKEMRRVLDAGGRVGVSVWQGMDRHPFYQTLHEMSLRRLGRSGVEGMFTLGDTEDLRALLTDAGFQRVEIESVSITARFPHPEQFLAWELDVDPAVTPALLRLDVAEQQAILAALRQDMEAPLREAMQGDHVVLPFHAHIARAQR